MQRNHRHQFFIAALSVFLLGLFVTCSEKSAGPSGNASSAQVNINMLKTSLSQAVSGVALQASVSDAVVHRDTTAVASGRFDFPDFSLPVGPATIIVDAFDANGRTIYTASSDVDITVGGSNAVDVELTPAVPMIRLAPYISDQSTGTKFDVTVEFHNIARFRQGIFTVEVDDDVARYDFFIESADSNWGTLGIQSTLQSPSVLEIIVSRSGDNDAIPAGVTNFLFIRFHGFGPGTTTLDLDVVELDDNSGPVGETSELVVDDATLTISGAADADVTLDPGLENAVRTNLQKHANANLYASELAMIIDLDAKDQGITNLTGIELMTALRRLDLSGNALAVIDELASLDLLVNLDLTGNRITDISAIVDNPGLSDGDVVILRENPLSENARNVQIPVLLGRGVMVVLSPEFSGIVTDAVTGDPLSGVSVTLSGAANRSTTTGPGGVFNFLNMAAGSYGVNLTHDGYESKSDTLTIADASVGRNYELSAVVTNTTISGTVNEIGAGPIARATVDLNGPMNGQALTDAQGFYQFSDVPPGQYNITVTGNGYESINRIFTVDAGSPEIQDFELSAILVLTTISGTVTEVGVGTVIRAHIDLSGVINGETATDDQGFYQLNNIPPGEYNIAVTATAYQSANRDFIVDAGVPEVQDFSLTAETYTVLGTITDNSQSAPILGATVLLTGDFSFNTSTDASGNYAISGVPAGDYILEVSANGFAPLSVHFGVIDQDVTQSHALEPSTILSVLFGTVTEQVGNSLVPLSAATIRADGPDTRITFTDAQGSYTFTDMPLGVYDVKATLGGYDSDSINVTLFQLPLAVNFTLAATTFGISGVITDAATQLQVSGAAISLDGPVQLNTTSNQSGAYSFDAIPPGDYSLGVTATGYEGANRQIRVTAESLVESFALVPLVPNTTVSGRVSNTGGGSLIGVDVDLSGPETLSTTTDQSGLYVFGNIPEGDYTLDLQLSGYAPQSFDLEVAGVPVVRDAILKTITTISGLVRDGSSTGPPVGDARVSLLNGLITTVQTDDKGFYELTNVLEGSYTFEAKKPGYAPVERPLTVSGSPLSENFVLLLGTAVSGLVSDEVTFDPIPGAKVTFIGSGGTFVATSNASGTFNLGTIPSGIYDYTVEAAGYETLSEFGITVSNSTFLIFPELVPN